MSAQRRSIASALGMLTTLASALALGGCIGEPTFTPMTNAPPGTIADYIENHRADTRTIRITSGLAFAIECEDGKSRPCSFDGSTTADPGIATIHRAYGDLDQVHSKSQLGTVDAYRTRTLFVVTGRRVGATTITIRTGNGDVPIRVEVL